MSVIELIAIKPLPIPEHPYAREEIEDYAWRFFNGEDKERRLTKAEKIIYERFRQRFVNYVENLPPWFQVVIIENRVPVRVGRRETIKLKQGYWGYATPDTFNVRLPESLLRLKGDHFEHYLSHELAHDLDNIFGLHDMLAADHKSQTYYSEGQTRWFRAIQHDMKQPNGRSPNNLNHQWRRVIKKYKPEEQSFESLAFILSYYLNGHFRLMEAANSNPSLDVAAEQHVLEQTMHRFFPNSWASFHQDMLPLMQEVAGDLYEARCVRKWDAIQRRESKLRFAMEGAIRFRGWPPIDDEHLVQRLASGYNTDWQYLFESLGKRLPQTSTQKLAAILPMIFDPMYHGIEQAEEGHKRAYRLSDFPELRVETEHFLKHMDDIAKNQGVSAFIAQYSQLRDNFYEALERKKKEVRARG